MPTAFEAINPFECNPFEFWAKAHMAAAEATIDLFKATTSLLKTAPGEPAMGSVRREIAPVSYEARVAEIRGATPSSPRSPARSSARTSTGKSWYRAPYRSPMDPLFWMTPGHPVDHVSDWMRPAMAAGAAFASPFATPFSAPLANPMQDLQSAAWMSPMTIWANMMPAASAGSGAAHRAQANTVDFETAYSAYRTAGGHASAQILADRPERRALAPAKPSAPAWGLPFMMFGWPPRFA